TTPPQRQSRHFGLERGGGPHAGFAPLRHGRAVGPVEVSQPDLERTEVAKPSPAAPDGWLVHSSTRSPSSATVTGPPKAASARCRVVWRSLVGQIWVRIRRPASARAACCPASVGVMWKGS